MNKEKGNRRRKKQKEKKCNLEICTYKKNEKIYFKINYWKLRLG